MFARLIENLCETGSINPRKRNRRKTRTDEAAEVAVLGAVEIILILVLDKLKDILEFLKQMYTAFLNVISFSPTTYRYTRNCMGTIFKIWPGMKWTRLVRPGLDWSGLDWLGLSWSGLA
jgi:hypothetical protein